MSVMNLKQPRQQLLRKPAALICAMALAGPLLLTGCGGSSTGAPAPSQPPAAIIAPPPQNLPLPDNRGNNPMQVLWFGNSHTTAHNLPDIVRQLLKAGAGIDARMTVAADYAYLDERWQRSADRQQLQSTGWAAVVLQAQKYSMSGSTHYSTQEAQHWIDLAKSHQIMPVLYPEHPQAGNLREGLRLQQLHQTIANATSACVAPVGLTWDVQLTRNPALKLHESDGNHANATGVLLTAYVFYQVLSGQSPLTVPDLPHLSIAVSTQQQLRQSAADLLAQQPACPF